METITAIRDTLLKKKAAQSNELSDAEKKITPKGTTYVVEKYTFVGENHYEVVLGYDAGTWFIFDTSGTDSHWDCSWEDNEEDDSLSSPDSGASNDKIIITTSGKINWRDSNIYISKYFRTVEVTKGDTNRFPKPNSAEEKNILALAQELDKLREDWGSGLTVNSWYRPPAVNRSIRGASNSQHIYGRGVDICPANGKLAELQNLCLKNWRGGVGKGLPKGFVHLDSRSGTPAWKAGSPTAVWIY